jgi:regulation of enolase protein 1 (concanavalin A-like superfamily)
MSKKFLSGIDLNKCELQNAVIQNLGTAPGTPAAGQVYFNSSTGDKSIYFYDGTAWVDVGGDLRSIVAGNAISVSGTRDITVNVLYDDASIGLNVSNQLYIKAGGVTNAMLVNSSLSVVAGAGLTDGGSVALGASVTLNIGAGTGITVNANDVALDTTSTRNTDHSAVILTAGAGLTGGGDITASRTFTVGAGTGITVNADDIAITGAGSLTTNYLTKWNGTGFSNSTITDDGTTVTIGGNLTVNGSITYVNSNTVEIGDNILLLNRDEVSAPSQNAGIEVERGTSTNVSFIWNETSDYWSTVTEPLHVGSIADAGAAYTGNKYLVSDSGVIKYLTSADLAGDVITGITISGSNGVAVAGSGTTSITVSGVNATTSAAGVVELATSAEVNALSSSTVAVTPSGLAALRYAATGPAAPATSMIVTHALASNDIIVQVYELATGENVECDVVRTTINVVTLGFCSPVTTNALRVLVIKIA